MTNALAGTAYLSVDGASYRLAGEFTYSVSTITRSTLTGQDGVHGYKEMPAAGFVSAKLRDSQDLTVADFNAMTDVNVVVELANGKTIAARNAWTVNTQEVATEEATFEVRWDSQNVSEN